MAYVSKKDAATADLVRSAKATGLRNYGKPKSTAASPLMFAMGGYVHPRDMRNHYSKDGKHCSPSTGKGYFTHDERAQRGDKTHG